MVYLDVKVFTDRRRQQQNMWTKVVKFEAMKELLEALQQEEAPEWLTQHLRTRVLLLHEVTANIAVKLPTMQILAQWL